jgi:phosphonoacetaldehyde hydrolase
MRKAANRTIRLVVFDWTGTLIDHGSVAPVHALIDAFESAGVLVTARQARSATGLPKRERIETILRIPDVLRRFQRVHERAPCRSDVDALHAAYLPAQLKAIRRCAELIDGAASSIRFLRARGIAVATTTGYFRAAAELVLDCARPQECIPDHAACPDDVMAGKPAPCMIYACMEALKICRTREVLVVGDSELDIVAGRNAGCLSVGVAGTGSEVGLTSAEWNALELHERNALLANAHRNLRDAGADFVIDTLSELPLVVDCIEERRLSSAA